MIDWQSVLQAVIVALVPALVALVLRAVRPLIEAGGEYLASRVSAEMREALREAAETAVYAAEAAGVAGLIKREGAALMEHAITLAQAYLNEHGLTGVSAATIAGAIRAALKRDVFDAGVGVRDLVLNGHGPAPFTEGWGASMVEADAV